MNHENQRTNMPIISEEESYLQRKRINGILEKSLQSFVTLITAGEGYGKTYAVSSFLRGRFERTIWIQLSERDNNLWRFWENFTGAVGYYNSPIGKSLAELGFPETVRQIYRYLKALEKAMVSDYKYVIVVDDVHLVQAKPVLEFMEGVLSVPVFNQSFIFIGRQEPAFNTVPLLSKGWLGRIGADELRFTEKEIGDFLAFRNIPCAPEELKNMYRDTEGWALAINFLAGEMEKSGENYTRQLLNTGTVRTLVDNTYKGLEEDLRIFLIQMSLLEQWPQELLETIAPRRELIKKMGNLSSLIRFEAYLHGYRIHRIFLDYLREKQGELSRDEVKRISSLAAAWCISNNLNMDAAINLERARDYKGLMDVIFGFPRIIPTAVASFFLDILNRLMEAEDRDEKNEEFLYLRHVTRPRLIMNLGRFEEADSELRAAVAYFEAQPPSPLSSHILSGCYINLGSLFTLTCRHTRDYSGVANFILADYYHMRHPREIRGAVTNVNITSYVNQVSYPAAAGEFERFNGAFATAVPHAANALSGYLYGIDDLGWAELAYFKGDLNGAEQFARQAVFKAREKGQYETENRGLFYLLRVHLHAGDSGAVREVRKQMEAQLEIPGYLNRYAIHDIVSGWFYAHTEQPEKVAPWLRNEFEESELNSIFHHFEILVKAKSLYTEKEYDAALDMLTFEENRASLGSYLVGFMEISALEAVTRYCLGDMEGAVTALEKAWEAGRANSLDMPFIELGEDMRLLLGEVLNGGGSIIPREQIEALRSRASAYGKKVFLVAEDLRREEMGGGKSAAYLTRQEQLVLGGLSQGLKREEIAEKNRFTLNMVKGLISSLYAKLGALNRADAIRVATNQGLLNTAEKLKPLRSGL